MLNNELLIASVDRQSDGLLVALIGTERLLGLNTPPLVRVWKVFGAPVSKLTSRCSAGTVPFAGSRFRSYMK